MLTYRKYIIANKLLQVLVAKGAAAGPADKKQQPDISADPPCIYNIFNRTYPRYSPKQVLKAMDLLQTRHHIMVDAKEESYTFLPIGYTDDGLAAYRQGYYEAAILKRSVTISTAIFIAGSSIALGLLEWTVL